MKTKTNYFIKQTETCDTSVFRLLFEASEKLESYLEGDKLNKEETQQLIASIDYLFERIIEE